MALIKDVLAQMQEDIQNSVEEILAGGPGSGRKPGFGMGLQSKYHYAMHKGLRMQHHMDVATHRSSLPQNRNGGALSVLDSGSRNYKKARDAYHKAAKAYKSGNEKLGDKHLAVAHNMRKSLTQLNRRVTV